MRLALAFVLVLACKDKTKTETPRPGSATTRDAGAPRPSAPLDPAALSSIDVPGWTRDVRLADRKGLELRYGADAVVITVQVAPCFDCLPMQLDRWRAKSDALRGLIPPELRDHASTAWDLGMTDVGGAPVAWTFHTGDTGTVYGSAYTLYFNDGHHMIRVVAESSARDVPKSRLEGAARHFLEVFVQRWG